MIENDGSNEHAARHELTKQSNTNAVLNLSKNLDIRRIKGKESVAS